MNVSALDWALCCSFLAILREGSLASAARVLEVAHPTVRRHLDELELVLGFVLFVRSPSGLVPTELALELQEPAEAMEAAAAQLVRIASTEVGVIAGTVRITASEVIGTEVLPPILSALKAQHQRLSFELALTNRIENVLRRDAEIAVRMTRPAQDDLIARKVGVVPVGLYAHENWAAEHGEVTNLAALIAAGSLIGYDREPAILHALAALRSGLGVAVCQTPPAARDARLRRVLPSFAHEMEVWLVAHPNLDGVNRVRATIDALAIGLAGYISATGDPKPRDILMLGRQSTSSMIRGYPCRFVGRSGQRNSSLHVMRLAPVKREDHMRCRPYQRRTPRPCSQPF